MIANPQLKVAFGQVIERLRRERGLSQEKLALAAQLNRTFVWRIERGEQNPSLDSLFRLAEALGLDPEDLVTETKNTLQSP
jgi:transcriptional regulator with XRE-family HTH domain